MTGCILAADGASLVFDGVGFLECVAAGVDPENRLWSMGTGFGGAAALVGDNCLDDATWTDSEGLGCADYNTVAPGGQQTLLLPSSFTDPGWTVAKQHAFARCEQAALFSNGGVDASAACCACKWYLHRRLLELVVHELLSQDGVLGECAETECRNPGPDGKNQVPAVCRASISSPYTLAYLILSSTPASTLS